MDGLCTVNEGKVATGDLQGGFLPCTPNGCMELIKKSGVKVQKYTYNDFFYEINFVKMDGNMIKKGIFEIGPNHACLKDTAKFISSLE